MSRMIVPLFLVACCWESIYAMLTVCYTIRSIYLDVHPRNRKWLRTYNPSISHIYICIYIYVDIYIYLCNDSYHVVDTMGCKKSSPNGSSTPRGSSLLAAHDALINHPWKMWNLGIVDPTALLTWCPMMAKKRIAYFWSCLFLDDHGFCSLKTQKTSCKRT